MSSFDIDWMRDVFLEFDRLSKPVMGIGDWDDAACVDFGSKKLLMTCDGPYKKRLVMKSALIHAATDLVVKGGKPMFAMDTLGGTEKDVREMAESLRRQGMRLKIPILGGNTNLEGEPIANIFVVGELLLDEPIRQSTAKKGDTLLLLGDPLWGEQEERFEKAEQLFDCWYELIKRVKINAAKDVTKGGLENTAKEMAQYSKLEYELSDLKIHKYRNLDNFLLSVDSKNAEKILNLASKRGCPCIEAGRLQ